MAVQSDRCQTVTINKWWQIYRSISVTGGQIWPHRSVVCASWLTEQANSCPQPSRGQRERYDLMKALTSVYVGAHCWLRNKVRLSAELMFSFGALQPEEHRGPEEFHKNCFSSSPGAAPALFNTAALILDPQRGGAGGAARTEIIRRVWGRKEVEERGRSVEKKTESEWLKSRIV